MKKLILALVILSSQAHSQTTIPNLNFESWTASSSGNYHEPDPSNIWATPNYVMDLIFGNPSGSIVQRSTDAHGGSYAALMKSRNIAGNFAGATLFTGKLNTTIPFSPTAQLGVPFTGRPYSMKGWYKYTSVNNDSSSIYIRLTKWNSTTNTRETVGFKEIRSYTSVATYTPFELVVDYTSSVTPDSITIVYSASAGAEQGNGQVGSSLWIDDVTLEYAPTSATNIDIEEQILLWPNPATEQLNLSNLNANKNVRIYSLFGQAMHESKANGKVLVLDISKWNIGLYFLDITDSNTNTTRRKTFLKN